MIYSTGSQSSPRAVAIADFNKDSFGDIVVANYGINSIGVFLNDKNGNFTKQIITSLGSSRPLTLGVDDFNKDHQLDIAVINDGTQTLAILFGCNDGTFNLTATYDMGYDSFPYSLGIADFNEDEKSDVALVNYGTSELVLLLTTFKNTFTILKYSTGRNSHPCSIATGDFNLDNRLDIVVANIATSSISVFLANGNGTFRNMILYSMESDLGLQSLVVGYFNDDNKLDIIVSSIELDVIYILKGDGEGRFTNIQAHPTGYKSDPFSIVVGDFDNDNKFDIAIANRASNNILILTSYFLYLNMSEVLFSTLPGSGLNAVDYGDFNNDSFIDIVISYYKTNSIGIFINLGTGSFTQQDLYYFDEYFSPFSIAVGDFTNDGYCDMVIVSQTDRKINVLIGYGNGTFAKSHEYIINNTTIPYMIRVGDFNNDDHLDLAIANSEPASIGLYFGHGNGKFLYKSHLLSKTNYSPEFIDIADFNSDERVDIIVSDRDNSNLIILFGHENGLFENETLISTEDDLPYSFTIGDLNNDNDFDIIYTNTLSSNIGILLGNGDGTFQNLIKYLTNENSKFWEIALGYFNEDSLTDIAVSNRDGSSVNIFLGHGNGTFSKGNKLSTGLFSSPRSLIFADFNNDNQQDLLVINDNVDTVALFLVHYDEDFANEINYTTGSAAHPYSVIVADLNHNGYADIIVTNAGRDDIDIIMDSGSRISYSTGFGSRPQNVLAADFNQDNILDVVVVNHWHNNFNIFLGIGNGSFSSKFDYPIENGAFPSSIAVGDFNEDNRIDIVIANQGSDNIILCLSYDYARYIYDFIFTSDNSFTPTHIDVGDFNSDSHLDVVVVNSFSETFIIYLGYSNGTFTEYFSYSIGSNSSIVSLGVYDFNNDHNLDIIVANMRMDLIVFFGFGDGNFQSPIINTKYIGSFSKSMAVGDFNNDDKLDIVVADCENHDVHVFLGYGNGNFENHHNHSIISEIYPTSIVVKDLNDDKIQDIIIANVYKKTIDILFGYGNGTFGDKIILSIENNFAPHSISTEDVNQDSLMDIIVVNQITSSIMIFFAVDNRSFVPTTMYSFPFPVELLSLAISDLNNDTLLDIIVSYYDTFNSGLKVFYAFGNGKFTNPQIYSTGFNSYPLMLALVDCNNDNRMDLIIIDHDMNNILLMIQQTIEPFSTQAIIFSYDKSDPSSIAVGDLNNDKRLDIVVANYGLNNIGILYGYGDGNFADQMIYLIDNNFLPTCINVNHLDSDTYLDIVVAYSATHNIVIYLGYGNGTFYVVETYSTGIDSSPSSIATADLNNDNNIDIIVSNRDINSILIFVGFGNGIFSNVKSYSIGFNAHPQSITIGDTNNDNRLDIIIANYDGNYIEILLQIC